MAGKQKKPIAPVTRPYLTGTPADARTGRMALSVLAFEAMIIIMTFLVSSALNFPSLALRVGLNAVLLLIGYYVLYNQAEGRGAEAVARGEILLQRQERGQEVSLAERALCFHPAKGYLAGALGMVPLFLCALALALLAQPQTTGIGTLPSWMSTYLRRSDIGEPLVAYTAEASLSVVDVLRIIVRMGVMPFVSMVGTENRDGMLLLERLSPVLSLLPALAYGTGYLRGRRIRTEIHTEIAENNRTRARKERRARKARTAAPKGPEQLN